MPTKTQPLVAAADGPDPLPGLLQRRAELERSLGHTLLAGGNTAGVRGALAAADAAIVAAKADRARLEAEAHRVREQHIRTAADDLVAKAATRLKATVDSLRIRPASDAHHN